MSSSRWAAISSRGQVTRNEFLSPSAHPDDNFRKNLSQLFAKLASRDLTPFAVENSARGTRRDQLSRIAMNVPSAGARGPDGFPQGVRLNRVTAQSQRARP